MKLRMALVVLATAVIVAACTNPGGLELGSLEIAIVAGPPEAVRTIATPPDYTVTSYRIRGTSDDAEFVQTVGAGETTVTQVGLEPGEWTIRVDALDGEETVLTGSTTVMIRGGAPTTVEVVLTEPEGEGTLSFGLRWPAGRVRRAAVSATLAPLGGEPESIRFSVYGLFGWATYSTQLPAGFYVLTVELMDGPQVVWGNAYAVRIRRGTTASESVNLTGADF
jgi:hypothetical protein